MASATAARGLRSRSEVHRFTASPLPRGCAPSRSPFPCTRSSCTSTHTQSAPASAVLGAPGPLAGRRGGNPSIYGFSACMAAPSEATTRFETYQGVAFDMDGTMTVSNIDFVKMREDANVPYGDLFTVMEAWNDESAIKSSMDIILDLEDEAEKTMQIMEGLRELLAYLRDAGTNVALVTRNTPKAVEAFFGLLGEEHSSIFDVVITRHHKYVKPDYRLLRDLAEKWGIPESSMLMVGDSGEDVECGNAAGTATAWISGGGNEVGAATSPPPGAVPTFVITGLPDLLARLRAGEIAPGWGVPGTAEGLASMSVSMDSIDDDGDVALAAGAPPPGVDFLDFVYGSGAIRTARCSFPRMGEAAGGLMGDATPGDRVLHVACGTGSLTKLLASQGLECVGIDVDAAAADRRGLTATEYDGSPLATGSLAPARAMGPSVAGVELPAADVGCFDAVVVFEPPAALFAVLASESGAREAGSILSPGGRLCLQACANGDEECALRGALESSGLVVRSSERVVVPSGPPALRLVAYKPGLGDA